MEEPTIDPLTTNAPTAPPTDTFTIREAGDREDSGIDTFDWHAVVDEHGVVAALFATHDHAVAFVDAMNGVG